MSLQNLYHKISDNQDKKLFSVLIFIFAKVTDTSTSTGNMDIEARLMGPGADGYDKGLKDAEDCTEEGIERIKSMEVYLWGVIGKLNFQFCVGV